MHTSVVGFFSIAGQYSTVGMCQNLSSDSPVDEHLGCFQYVTIVNKTSMNICFCGHIFSLLLDKYLRGELPSQRVGVQVYV